MWARLRERPERERREVPARGQQQGPPPELRTSLRAQAQVFAHQR